MLPVLSKLIWPLLNPANLILLLLVFSALLTLVRRFRTWGRGGMGSAILLIALAGTLPVGDWLLRPLEEWFPPPALPAKVDGIVVLSGAEQPGLTTLRGQPHLNGGAERHLMFIALARQFPGAKLVYSGGGVPASEATLREADVAEMVFRSVGFDTGRVIFERQSRNTIENAQMARALANPREGEIWLLVTSAYHMPRAVNCFRAVDWPVVPYPVDFGTGGRASFGFNPLGGLGALGAAAREWLGLVAYRILGHTRTILPERA